MPMGGSDWVQLAAAFCSFGGLIVAAVSSFGTGAVGKERMQTRLFEIEELRNSREIESLRIVKSKWESKKSSGESKKSSGWWW